MAIVRWKDPFRIMSRSWPALWSDDDFLSQEDQGIDVYETDNDVVVKANVAGVPADKVDVSVEGRSLTIKAEHEETEEEKRKKKVVYREGRTAKYLYSTTLPYPVKAQSAQAEVENGMVTVTIPKKEEAKRKKIKVKAKGKK